MAKKTKWKYDLSTESIRPLWTDEPPTEPGLYWWRLKEMPEMLTYTRVKYDEDSKLVAENKINPLVRPLIKQWAGPLLEPEE